MNAPLSFNSFVKANPALNFNLSALQNARKVVNKVSSPSVELVAMVNAGNEKFTACKLAYKEYVLNRIVPGAGTLVVETLTAEEREAQEQASALFNLQFPLNVKIPNIFCIGKTSNSEATARKANSFFATLKETIAPSTIEGISKGTLSLAWLCNALGIKKASEATQVLSMIGSASRKAWIDGDNENYISLSVGKDSGSGMICFKWSIKD